MTDFGIAVYETARRSLAEAKTMDDLKGIIDIAAAMKAYAARAKNKELEADAVEIRMRATRRVAELMKAQAATVGLATGREGKRSSRDIKNPESRPTLAEAGIDKNLAIAARELGRLSDAQFEEAIEHARDSTTRAVRNAVYAKVIENERAGYESIIYEGGTVDDLAELGETVKAGAIYGDPPWKFEAYSGKGKQRLADRHYDTMTIKQLCAMADAVNAVAAPDCALFLCAVMPELQGALDVMEAWGFEYKTAAFAWLKTNADGTPATGMGYWTRSNIELVLLGTRGKPKRLAKDVSQVILAPRGEHSEKPAEIRDRIKRLVPGPYLELFAREPADGWYSWGNQIAVEKEAAE